MCGDKSRQSLGGALAILSLPFQSTCATSPAMAGRLTFHSQGKGGSTATHATFTADKGSGSGFTDMESCVVGIHETGDLTRSAVISPFLHKFNMSPDVSLLGCAKRRAMEVELRRPMKIEVGGDGIIGRRVSVWIARGVDPVAEGIIGYN
ncbi:Uu.00g061430.m01.CDS01 [Anthostomella pinea]|uniref:Uu.00g061430.m01.CDS01 n=1 Tax=Anthostomella pinea TaxID=933095 RepID=A0AAI8VT96_9PEZI|nr:Uu.00g061430.m01.CDS01 [Anthostomella pinea]